MPDGDRLPEEVAHPETVALRLGDCEAHWLPLGVGLVLGHWLGEAEGEPVPIKLALEERDRLLVEHTVGVRVPHEELLSDGEALPETEKVAVGHCERVTEGLSEGVCVGLAVPQGEGERVSDGLFDKEGEMLCVLDEETLPEEVTHPERVALRLCDCEAHWLPLDEGVLLRHSVGEMERVPVPVRLPLGESERLTVAHTVGV